MKNISAMQSKVGSDSFKGWVIGMACGLLLATIIVLGTGHLVLNQRQNTQSVSGAQQAPLVTSEGAAPVSDDALPYQQYQQELPKSTGLVPPPIDEIQQYRRTEQAIQAGAGLVPPPIDEIQKYRRQSVRVLDSDLPPMPMTPGANY
ncbi:MAG: hypothetical protein WBW04_20575 [Nitrolancea sp.]